MKLASSDARKAMTLAISSGSANLPIGTRSSQASFTPGMAKTAEMIGVDTGPGQTALILTPSRA